MKKLKFIQQTFSVHLFETNDSPFVLSSWKLIKSIKADSSFIKNNPVEIVADPFLFVHDECLYVFYEKQISINNGVIEMVKTEDTINWTKPITILKRNTHLSYPFVFKDSNGIFMIPETSINKNIQLYKANQNLSEWCFEKEILKGDVYTDSSIFFYDNVYYLFTTTKQNKDYQLHLFFSENLYGEFEEHPKSPVTTGNSVGRCGGAIFEFENQLYRPAQVCENYYGESLSIFNIKILSTKDYQEEIKIDRLLTKQFKNGGHHFNIAKFNNKLIIASDAVNFTFNFFAFYDRVVKYIKKVIKR